MCSMSASQVEDSGPQMVEVFEAEEVAEEVAEAPREGEEGEEVAEEALEEGRKSWWSHTDMKVFAYQFYKIIHITCIFCFCSYSELIGCLLKQ